MIPGLLYNPVINWAIAILLLFYGPVLIIVLIYKVLGFTGYMSLFKYAGGDSFIYRLDPRTKILLAIILTIVAAMTIWWISAIFLAGVLMLYLFLRNPVAKMRVAGPLILATFIGTAWSESLFAPFTYLYAIFNHHVTFIYLLPPILSSLGVTQGNSSASVFLLGSTASPVGLTWEGLIYGLQISFRATASIASGLLLIFSASPSDILRSLEKSKLPIELGFTLLLAASSIPKVLESSMIVINALKARGVDVVPRGSRNPIVIFKRLGASFRVVILSLTAIIILTLRNAREIAIAADLRGFRANKYRTYYHELKLTRLDLFVIAMLVVILIIGVYVSGLPGMGAVPYNP